MGSFAGNRFHRRRNALAVSFLTSVALVASADVSFADPSDPWPPDPSQIECTPALFGIFDSCDGLDWYSDMYNTDWSTSVGYTTLGILAISAPVLESNPSLIGNLQLEIDRFGWSLPWRQCVRKVIAQSAFDILPATASVAAMADYFELVRFLLDGADTPYRGLVDGYLDLIDAGGDFGLYYQTLTLMEVFYAEVMNCDESVVTGTPPGRWTNAGRVTGPVLGSKNASDTVDVAFVWDVPPVYRENNVDATLRMTVLHWSNSVASGRHEKPYIVYRNYCYSSFTDSIRLGSTGMITTERSGANATPTATWPTSFLKGGCDGPHLTYDHTEIVDERAGNVLADYYPKGHPEY